MKLMYFYFICSINNINVFVEISAFEQYLNEQGTLPPIHQFDLLSK